MRQKRYDLLIVGGGFSGTILACQVARYSNHRLSIAVLERNGRPGRGIAYGTQCSEHLLNVPAGNMSAFPDHPGHFVDWLSKVAPAMANSTEFVPRWLFGQYVGEQLDRIRAETLSVLTWIDAEAVAIHQSEPQMIFVQLLSGVELEATCVVLATGGYPPADPVPFQQKSSGSYIRYAWSKDALHGLADSGAVLLLGSGLTAIDQVLALNAKGFRGRVYLLSRRGLLPHTHFPTKSWSTNWTQNLPQTARGLLARVRREARQAQSESNNWRAVIDSLRPHSQKIWQALPLEEQKRFLRHVRPYWETHRHRYAPQLHHLLVQLQEAEKLQIIAGRAIECRCGPSSAEVRYTTRTTGEESVLKVDRIVNCTGPEADFRKLRDRFTRSLLSQGLARPDPLSLGLETSEDGALINPTGLPSRNLFAVGPLRKGSLWETTAVPEIRVQADTLARLLAGRSKTVE